MLASSLDTTWTALERGLLAGESLWRPSPFSLAHTSLWHKALHEEALLLDEAELNELQTAEPCQLFAWASNGVAGTEISDRMEDLQEVLETCRVSAECVAPPFARRTQPRQARGIPGRKWEQIEAFAELARAKGGGGSSKIVDWCSGKGHLARQLYACGCCNEVDCLEIDKALIAAGRALSPSLPIRFHEHDVLTDPLPSSVSGPSRMHTALHACGELHRQMLRTAVRERAQRLVVAPCCYEKHRLGSSSSSSSSSSFSDPFAAAFSPLSATVASRSTLRLRHEDLYLARADGPVTGSAKERSLRTRERTWRLAFDCWRREVTAGQQETASLASAGDDDPLGAWRHTGVACDEVVAAQREEAVLEVPSAPRRILVHGDALPEEAFATFCRHCVSADGRNADARRQLAPALEAAIASGALRSQGYVERGAALLGRVERLELVRRAFQRPLELWLASDLALYLEESGYDVEMTALCERKITPRNIAIVAQRRLAS